MAKLYYAPWQNPSWPQDMDMSADEIARGARAASLQRAQSPGNLVCKLDGSWSYDDPFHADSFYACMDYRHRNVVGDQDPWTYWELMDAPLIGPKGIVPPLPVGLMDWQVRALAGKPPVGVVPPVPPPAPVDGQAPKARVWTIMVQAGINSTQQIDADGNYVYDSRGNAVMVPVAPAMLGVTGGWNGYSWSMLYTPDVISPLVAPYDMRVTVVGSYTLDHLYIGAANASDILLINLNHQLYFWTDDSGNPLNPNDTSGQKSKSVIVNLDDNGNFVSVTTLRLGFGIDPTNGLWISGYFNANGNGLPGVQYGDVDHMIFDTWEPIDLAANTNRGDTNAWNNLTAYALSAYGNWGSVQTDLAVLTVEGLYDESQVPKGQPTTPDTTPTSLILPRRSVLPLPRIATRRR